MFKYSIPGIEVDVLRDIVNIIHACGICWVSVKKPSGNTYVLRFISNGINDEMIPFYVSTMIISERRRLVSKMVKAGFRNADVAKILGLSYPTISTDLRRHDEAMAQRK